MAFFGCFVGVGLVAVLFAFIGVVFIWGSTPLAMQWSLHDVSFLFAVMARTVLGLIVCLVAVSFAQQKIPTHWQALRTYLAGGLGIFGSMMVTYWGARFIPSGWISVLFGLSPFVTGILAFFWLNERFGWDRWVGTLFGLVGLILIFLEGTASGSMQTLWGIGAMVCAVVIYGVSTVLVKHSGRGIPATAITFGNLVVATPCFIFFWLLDGTDLPTVLSLKTTCAILYLAIMGSLIGFVLFYFVLERLDTSQTMLITLLAPVVALSLGAMLNNENPKGPFLSGVVMILLGLATYQWGRRIMARFERKILLSP